MSQSLRITRETKTGTTPHLNPQSEPTRVTRVGSRKHVAHASRPNTARRPRKGRPRTRSSRRKSRRGCTPRAHVWRRGFWGTLFPSFRTVCQYLSFAKLLTSRPGSWFRDRIPRRACRARARTVGARRVRTFGTRVTAFLGAASWSSRVLWEVQGRPDARCRRSTPCYEMSSDTASTGAVTEPVTAAAALVAADPAAAMVSGALSNVMSDTAPAPNPAPEPEASAEVRISDHSSFRVPCFSRTYLHSLCPDTPASDPAHLVLYCHSSRNLLLRNSRLPRWLLPPSRRQRDPRARREAPTRRKPIRPRHRRRMSSRMSNHTTRRRNPRRLPQRLRKHRRIRWGIHTQSLRTTRSQLWWVERWKKLLLTSRRRSPLRPSKRRRRRRRRNPLSRQRHRRLQPPRSIPSRPWWAVRF